MDKHNPPHSFGVFKPTGHTVVAFADLETADTAASALQQKGFGGESLVRYTPQEMKIQVAADMHSASPIAAVGQELNLVRAHGALAEAGCHFLVVHTPDAKQVALVMEVIERFHAKAAQRYGAFIIEDLIGLPRGEVQTFESPDRGLDLEVRGQARR